MNSSEGNLQAEVDALRQRIAQLEAEKARAEGERDEARRLLAEAFKALARDPAVERELERAERKREADRVRAQQKTGRDSRANSRDDGGGGDLEIVSVEVDPPSTSPEPPRANSRDDGPPVSAETTRFWLWCQDQRRAAGAGVREVMPKNRKGLHFPRWFTEASTEVGVDALAEAFLAYLTDQHFKRKQWSMAIFMSDQVWRQRVPRALADQHRDAQLGAEPPAPAAAPPAEAPEHVPPELPCRWPWSCTVPDCTHPTPGRKEEAP
jgi:hypothetical protein